MYFVSIDWIETQNKDILPINNNIYWVTVDFLGGYMTEAKYHDGNWYRNDDYRYKKPLDNVVAWYNIPKPEMYKIPPKKGIIFPEFEVNEMGINKNIKANVLPDSEMRAIGFTNSNKTYWYFSRMIEKEISFSITINKMNPKDFRIDILDEDFCQPYDYQSILMKNKDNEFAKNIFYKVEEQMEYLSKKGVISGHKYGEYI